MTNHYYQDDYVTIYCGDCREIVPGLGRFDFMWTDPPYNVGKDYGDHNDSMDYAEYMGWCAEWIYMAETSCINTAVYPPKIYLREFMNFLPQHHLVIASWRPYGAIRGGYVHQYAPLLLPQNPKKRVQDHWEKVNAPGCGMYFHENTYGHPGYTSYDITTKVLGCCTEIGDTVIDYFAGTGTTGRAAKDLNRQAVLIEREEKYCEIAAKRMRQEVLPLYGECKQQNINMEAK